MSDGAADERGTAAVAVDVVAPRIPTTKAMTNIVQPTMSHSYNERSSFQRTLNEVARPHLCRAIAGLARRAVQRQGTKKSTLFVTDFGCSEGANAVEQMAAAVDSAFAAAEGGGEDSELSITVAHCDLTNNGWGAVAAAISAAGKRYVGERRRVDGGGGVAGGGVAGKAEGRVVAVMHASDAGFYGRCFDDASVDLCHGAVTFHWASRDDAESSLPFELDEGDECLLPGLSTKSNETLALASRAARRDWERILRHRAAEIRPGGLLVAALICTDPGDNVCALWRKLASCVGDLVAEGAVTADEARSMVVPVHLRSPEDHSAPFRTKEKGGGGGGGGERGEKDLCELFRVVVDESSLVQSPERAAYLLRTSKDKELDGGEERAAASEQYGHDVAAFFEAVSRTMVEGALRSRLGDGAAAVADELYFGRFAREVARDTPPFDILLQTLVLERI